jgi:hypothetical protein
MEECLDFIDNILKVSTPIIVGKMSVRLVHARILVFVCLYAHVHVFVSFICLFSLL